MIRKAHLRDLDQILAIYARAREYMRQTGNPHQWKDSWPAQDILEEDIALGQLYVLEEDGTLQGVFALIPGEDPTYRCIEGRWRSSGPYAAVHRVASAGHRSGVLADCLAWCEGLYPDLRIDTHRDNAIMQHLLEKQGFQRCGIIYLENGDPRIAYEK